MGTVIFDKFGVIVKRFYGGEKRGVCFQLSIMAEDGSFHYIQLTEIDFIDLIGTSLFEHLKWRWKNR